MAEKIELELPPAMENVDTSPHRKNTPKSRTASPTQAELGSLFQALSNRDKLRSDIDGVSFIKEMKGGNKREENRRDDDRRDDRDRDRDRDRERDDRERGRDKDNDRDDRRESSHKSNRSSTAKNLFSHLKNISERVEKEDDRERHKKSRSPYRPKTQSYQYQDECVEEKALLLQSYHLLKAQGVKSDMLLDISADILTLRTEVTRMQTEINSQKCVKFARKALIAMVSGIEFVNSKYDPLGLHLNGWSEHIMTTLGDYDSVFMRLYDKYKDRAGSLSPEVELMILLGGSGLMFHLTQSFINQNVPKFTDVAKESPELANKIAGIMASKYNKEQPVDSSDSDEDVPVRKPKPEANPRVKLPTDMLSTPAFPAMIQRMVSPRPEYTPPVREKHVPPMDTIKEIPISVKPLKEKSENVLVIS